VTRGPRAGRDRGSDGRVRPGRAGGAAPALAALAAALLLSGCARSGFPPGGPIDTTPPTVLEVTPADSSVHVPAEEAVEIDFSESMDHASVQDGLRMFPPPRGLSLHWSGKRLRVSWQDSLAPATTYHVVLSGTAKDAHAVPMGKELHVRFSTGDSLDPGSISGVVRAKTLGTKGVPIVVYPESLGMRPDFGSLTPTYATETDTSGAYDFTAIHLGAYTLHALYDRNHDNYIDTTSDLVITYPEPIRLTPEHAVADSINLTAVDPHAPAVISGRIVTADSLFRYRIEARPDTDSTYVVQKVERQGHGDYVLRVPPGRYRLAAVRLAGPGNEPPRLTVTLPDVIDGKPEQEYPGRDFEFPPKAEAAPAPPGAPKSKE
jgi:hypothetical protein